MTDPTNPDHAPASPDAAPPSPAAPPHPVVRLDADAVCQRRAIGPRHLHRLLAKGRFPPPDLRVGANGRRLWNLETVQAWELAQTPGTRGQA